jgi:anti-anti-sigma regulatory factor
MFNLEKDKMMEIKINKLQGPANVTILQLTGKLDGSNYLELVEEARRVYMDGARDLLIDMSQLTYMSSSGIAAIHKTALMFRGMPVLEDESGWSAYHAIDRDRSNGVQQHVKLLSPQPEVARVLELSGFTGLFEIHSDLSQAVASFQ